jgi:hypothetical protein
MRMAVLLCVAASCDITPGGGSGEKVAILFSTATGNEEEEDVVLRSDGVGESETQVFSLGSDLYLYATWKPEADELRAEVAPAEGQKVCLSAYSAGSTTPVSTAMYTYTGGQMVADEDNLLEVEPGHSYNFTAYSYYNSTETPSATDVDPVKDLVWGQQTKEITSGSRTVTIVMNHRFSKARVKVKSDISGATITALSGVEIASSYADLSVSDGVLSKKSAITLPVTFEDFSSIIDITGNETHLVYPGVRVNIASMTVEVSGIATPVVMTGLSLGYNLTGGKRYVLEVNVRRSRWARSNIYWVPTGTDTGYMTFDVVDAGHQGYQGVFFRWGSLVGVSPARVGTSTSYSINTPIYVPTYQVADTLASSWSRKSGSSGVSANPYDTWDLAVAGVHASDKEIPYLDGFYNAEPYGIDNTYVMDAERNTAAMYDSLRGDICQYLGKTNPALYGYRLPIQNEFPSGNTSWNTVTPDANGWIKGDGSFTNITAAGYADGRADLLVTQQGTGYDPAQPTNGAGVKLGAAINQAMGVVFPAAGYHNIGTLNNVGRLGYYSCCSARNETRNWELYFTEESLGAQANGVNRTVALPVRCIRKLTGEP